MAAILVLVSAHPAGVLSDSCRAMAVCRERGGASFPVGSADEVEAELRRRLCADAFDADAALSLGDVLHLVRGDADAAALHFERVLESDSSNVRAMCAYALVLLRERRDYLRAELLVLRVLRRQPRHIPALEMQAWLELHVHHRLQSARDICERALQAPTSAPGMPPLSLSLLRTYASVLVRQGQIMCAAAILETALQLDPHDVWTLRRLAQVLQDRDLGVSELLQLQARHLAGMGAGMRESSNAGEDKDDESSEVGHGVMFVEPGGGDSRLTRAEMRDFKSRDLGQEQAEVPMRSERHCSAWKAVHDPAPLREAVLELWIDETQGKNKTAKQEQGTGGVATVGRLAGGSVPVEHQHCEIQYGLRGACQGVLLAGMVGAWWRVRSRLMCGFARAATRARAHACA
jgi:Tfp pilus assembly protein PilF